MSLKLNTAVGSLRPPQLNILFLNATSFHRLWMPSRRKRSTHLVIRSNHQLSSSLYSAQDTLFHAFLSQLNSLDLLAPALGFTSALAILYNSTRTTHLSNGIGDWTLFTSPTPFNRFVKLRCQSLLLEDSNEKLISEDGHFVSFDTGPIQQTGVNDYTDFVLGKQLSYQRICVKTDDGGVVSLDWPANLDLTNEHGLDTTVLVIAGTTDGSMDENVMSFVYECLKRGCFPIVMNPRGCAHSPLTTPRLFTAADSDDVCTTVQFINRARPWTTLMGVGFGYGANMLTKYLAEVGEETPLTAATCLDNPFDLERANESPNHLHVNQNLTNGLIDMLKSNKELFQGRSKGFDIEKALYAKSLQEFEEAISMVSYGFHSIEEFYANSSTRDVVSKVKIPLLFIQDDEVQSFSIPRGLIAENPYTSLLTCTLQSKDKSNTGTSAVSWCQHLAVEWLTSIELGLLKGRHPLLEDTDVTINPSKSLKLMASKSSHSKKMLKANDTDSSSFEEKDKEVKKITNGSATQTNVVEAEVVKEEETDLTDSERGKLLQATEVVMNMLDVTMPEALSEEQKKKVLTAIGKGETLMTALQGAVPEDVRGKLTTAVTGILESKKKALDGISSISKIPDVLTKKIQEKEPKSTSEVKPEHEGKPAQVDDSDSSDGSSKVEDKVKEQVKPEHEGEAKEEKKEETNEPNPVTEESPQPVPPPIEAPQALEAITGIDDSTQVAVNSVFSIIEGVITQVEGDEDDDSEIDDKNEVEDTSTESEKKHKTESKSDLQQKQDEESTKLSTDSEKKHQTESKSDLQQKKDDESIKISKNSEKKHQIDVKDTSTDSEKKHQTKSESDLHQKKDEEIIKLSTDSEKKHQTEVEDTSKDPEKKHQTESESDLHQKKDEEIIELSEDSEKKHQTESKSDLKQKKDEESMKIKLSTEKKDEGKSGDDDVIEPDYVILDSETDWDKKGKLEIDDEGSVVLMQRVKENILKSLKVEVCRRIDATEMVDMASTLKKEVEHVADAISISVVNEKHHIISWNGEDLFGHGNPYAERILDSITSAVESTTYLKKAIPLGIVVGSSLASLKKVFNFSQTDPIANSVADQSPLKQVNLQNKKVNSKYEVYEEEDDVYEEEEEVSLSSSLGSDTVMAGAVTAAIGASALLVHQQGSIGEGLESSLSSFSFNQNENNEEPRKMLEENTSDSSDSNIVTSLAEKAMAVAAPVVPTKEDGAVDQDRLVAMLADLGQRGGMLRLVGKFALLWGGIRGAMSLIGKLISFLKLSKRPLYQRILGFVSLVLVLWTPVVVPLLPTLVQNWATNNSSANGFAQLACIIGLYGSIVVLVVLWGKRIRGYENPFERYGLNFKSTTQFKNLTLGLIGGVMFVSLIQFTNTTLGLVSISWSPTAPSSTDAVTLLKFSGDVVRIVSQGLITATAIALVEELLFRSWLPEEIAADLGYNKGVILSAVAFSISQWSLKAIPGLWLLSLGLAGVRQRSGGSLALPIGLRAGIMGSSFFLKEGGFLIFQPNYPSWLISGDPFQPFSSVVGLVFALSWAVILYPRNPKKETQLIKQDKEKTPLE